MEPKKVKKLVLKKETISNLSTADQNRIIGGDWICELDRLICGTNSHFAPEQCALNCAGTVPSYCICSPDNGGNGGGNYGGGGGLGSNTGATPAITTDIGFCCEETQGGFTCPVTGYEWLCPVSLWPCY